MENRKKIDDLFKSELGDYTEAPPPAAWDALEGRLDNMPAGKSRRPLPWLGYFALVCALIAISISVAKNLASNGTGMKIPLAKNNTHGKNETITTAPDHANTTGTNNEQSTAVPPGNTTQQTPNNATGTDKANDNIPVNNNPTPGKNETNKTANRWIGAPNDNNNPTGIIHEDNNTNKHNSKTQHNRTARTGSIPRHTNGIKTQGTSIPDDSNNEVAAAGTPVSKQPENIYNSAGNNEVNNATTDNKTQATTQTETTTTITPTPPNTSNNKHDNPNTPSKHDQVAPKPKFARFEAGLKAGYELGFDNDAAKKNVFSPYVQYRISPKLAIMLQPAIKAASLSGRQIGGASAYYKVNNDGTLYAKTDSIPIIIIGTSDSLWLWHYNYVQTHDSIIKTNTKGGTYTEFELPVLLKYNITKDFAVYGGVNIAYGRQTGITEHTQVISTIPKAASAELIGPANAAPPSPPKELPNEISYYGTPYSNYTGPAFPVPDGSLVRYGYMLGFTYEYKKVLFDALIQQGAAKTFIQGGYNINTPLSAPYIRLSIGYKLTK